MSTGSRIPTTLRQCNKEVLDIQDHQVPQSAILYLLQEAIKIAPPAKQGYLHSRALDENLFDEKKEQQKHFPSAIGGASTRHHSNHNDTGSFAISPIQQSSSPWEVMSLINLQCERLLHPENREEEDLDRVTHHSSALVCESTASSTMELKSTGHSMRLSSDKEGDSSSAVPQCSEEAVEIAGASGPCSRAHQASLPEECGTNSNESLSESLQYNQFTTEGSSVESNISEIIDEDDRAINENGRDEQAIGSLQFAGTESGDTCSLRNCSLIIKGKHWPLDGGRETMSSPEGKRKGLCNKHYTVHSEPHLNLLAPLIQQHNQQLATTFTGNSDELACSSSALWCAVSGDSLVSPGGVKMDCNANEVSSFDPPEDVQSQSGPPALTDLSNGECAAENQNQNPCEGVSAPESEPCGSCVENTGGQQLKLKETHPVSEMKLQARKPRKQSHPTRSADLCDPDFKGVTFRMHTELNDSRDQCRLLITSNYSAEFLKSNRRVRSGRPRSFVSSLKTSSSEEESDSSTLSKNKVCASCNTKKTPLWRDAEDGTPLCNACGIRYKKYRIRCLQCWHIPRKEGNSNSKCYKCGDVLRLATSQRKLTGL